MKKKHSTIPIVFIWLVVSTPLKNLIVIGKDDKPYIMENNGK
jgi:hypothetical protein